MKKIWDTYFYWNRTERRGVVPLFVLLLMLIAASVVIRNRPGDKLAEPDADFMASARQFEKTKNEIPVVDSSAGDQFGNSKPGFYPKANKYKRPAAPFNPNDFSTSQWMDLGLTEKQAASIGRFREKGGRFYKKEDLQKMYVISEEFYEIIEPYLVFEKVEKQMWAKPSSANTIATSSKIDINKADSIQLVSLKGITPKMVQKMLAVRKTFGGYHSLEQIKDLYGFYESNYYQLSEMAFVGAVEIKTLNINYCTFKELLQVPGLDYESVKKIIHHREHNGSFQKTEDLVTLNLAEPDLYAKIAPYLTVK